MLTIFPLGILPVILIALVFRKFIVKKITLNIHLANLISLIIGVIFILGIIGIIFRSFSLLDIILVFEIIAVLLFSFPIIEILSSVSKKIKIISVLFLILVELPLILLTKDILLVYSFATPDRIIYELIHGERKEAAAPKNQIDCLAAGGDWGRRGRAGANNGESCQIPAKDGGNSCVSGFQCSYGQCISPYKQSGFLFHKGVCAKYKTNFGCNRSIYFGISTQALCTD